MLFIILALLVIIAALFSLGVGESKYTTPRIKLPEIDNRPKKFRVFSALSIILPFSGALLEKIGMDVRIRRKLDAAHLKLSVTEFFNLQILMMAGITIAAVLSFGRLQPWAIALCIAAGYVIPEFYLSSKIAKRRNVIVRLLPETVDLWGLCVEAGLDFNTALKWVTEKVSNNPLIEELTFVWEEITWGKPRIQALRDMSKRLNIPEISSFVHTLAQSERMGTPVAEAFAILSEDTRIQRFNRGERIALKAPLKILIPLIFCILPVIGIVIGGPIMLQFMQGGLLNAIGR